MVSAQEQMDAGRARGMAQNAVIQTEQTGTASGCETMEQLFAALESSLLSYALRLTGEISVAEDVVQEAFMKLQAQFKEVRDPKRWLYRTAHNLALNHRRQSRKIIPLEPTPASGNEAADTRLTPDEQIARSEGINLVRLTLETLDERSRELIRLKFTENLSYKEISQRTGLKTGHIGYLLHHALKEMADELAKNGVVP
ncbi:MAG TPA: sigma-70 family RNA polymerase sigma factor [Verrucomicrobiae bacterium]|jgi:RNA polymerase sigma-70 factor (ECF subfamily)|nr:sigma-70 family RNA polymerase sigma factor [Verrucomicrobiae bacterium]